MFETSMLIGESFVAGTETPERVVQARRHADQLGRCGAVEVWSAKPRRALERAVLVEYDTRRDQSSPGQPVCQQGGACAVFGKMHHGVFSVGLIRPAACGA